MTDLVPSTPDPETLPWERQPGEPIRAFAHFAAYRDLGPLRSLAKLARLRNRSVSTFAEMSAREGWVERAEAYDEYLDRLRRDEQETELLRAERREIATGQQIEALAATRIFGRPGGVREDGTIVEAVDAIDPRELDPVDAVKLYGEGMKIRRVAAGQPTDVLRQMHSITAADLVRVVEGVYEIASRFVEEDRLPRFASEVQSFIDSGRLPWDPRS